MLLVKGGQKLPKEELIPTPSFGLNHIIGGGLWSGRFHILWGNPQAGKSTLALHTMAEAQKLGYTPVIVDAEGSMTDDWMEFCGIDLEQRIVIRSTVLEDILKVIMPMFRERDKKYIFLIDSLNTIVMEQFYKNDDGTGGIAIYARSQGALIQKVADQLISGVNHCVIFIAQQTIAAKGQHFVTAGKFGKSAEHWATNIIRLNASDASGMVEKDKDDRITEREVSWGMSKSKQRPVQGTKGSYFFSPETASIDKVREAFHIAVRHDIIKKSGAWFYYKDEKYHGEVKCLEAITEEDMADIMEQLQTMDLDFDYDESVVIKDE